MRKRNKNKKKKFSKTDKQNKMKITIEVSSIEEAKQLFTNGSIPTYVGDAPNISDYESRINGANRRLYEDIVKAVDSQQGWVTNELGEIRNSIAMLTEKLAEGSSVSTDDKKTRKTKTVKAVNIPEVTAINEGAVQSLQSVELTEIPETPVEEVPESQVFTSAVTEIPAVVDTDAIPTADDIRKLAYSVNTFSDEARDKVLEALKSLGASNFPELKTEKYIQFAQKIRDIASQFNIDLKN